MLFHPAVMSLLLADLVSMALLLPTGPFAVRVLRHWDLSSGSARQTRLERQTYLAATVVGFVLVVQILSLLLLVFTADRMAVQFVGAMCAVGTFNVNAFGFPALYLKLVLYFLAAAWLFMNRVDNRAPDYPLIRVKYGLLLLILPVAITAAVVQCIYFLNLRADVITSCCGTLFSAGSDTVAAELASLSPATTMALFFTAMIAVVVSGIHYLWRRRGPLLFSALGAIAFPVAIAAMVSFVSLYIYEHPHHHCPFCLLKADYGYVGYLLYVPLFMAVALAVGLGATLPFVRTATLRSVMDRATPRVVAIATALFSLFTLTVTWLSWRSPLVLLQ